MRLCVGQILVVYQKVLKVTCICENKTVLMGCGQMEPVCHKPRPLCGSTQSSFRCAWVLCSLILHLALKYPSGNPGPVWKITRIQTKLFFVFFFSWNVYWNNYLTTIRKRKNTWANIYIWSIIRKDFVLSVVL